MNALTAKSDEEVDQRHLVRSQASALVVEKKKPLAYCESQKFAGSDTRRSCARCACEKA